jgi:hypothetical protein
MSPALNVELDTTALIQIVQRGEPQAPTSEIYYSAKRQLEAPFEELDGRYVIAKIAAKGYDSTMVGKVNWPKRKLELSWRESGSASNTSELYWLEVVDVLHRDSKEPERKVPEFPPFDGLRTSVDIIRPSRLVGAALAVIHEAEATESEDVAKLISESVMTYIGALSGANGPITPEVMAEEMDWDGDQRTQAAVYAHACWYTGTLHNYPGGREKFIDDVAFSLFADLYDFPGKEN